MKWNIRLLSKDVNLAIHEIQQCVELQKVVGWDTEICPSHIIRADSINLVDESINLGYVLIAVVHNENQETVIGFSRVTFTRDLAKHWLHEIVICSKYQSDGIGFSMMNIIKNQSIKLGGKELYFTYDPLEGQNGRLYLTKCGAKAIRVYENFYGQPTSMAHANRKTHRVLVRWDLEHKTMPIIENIDMIPISNDLSSLEKISQTRIEIPYNVKSLTDTEAKNWQDIIFPILQETINISGYQATYLQTVSTLKAGEIR